jgi:hypothetical protein
LEGTVPIMPLIMEGIVPIMPLIMEGTRPIIMNKEGTPPLRGVPYPTF